MATKKQKKEVKKLILELMETYESTSKNLEKALKKKGYDVISKWYRSYSPTSYALRRQNSLYDAFRIDFSDDGFEIYSDASLLDEAGYIHHQKNDIIYNNAFVFGYHGGFCGKTLVDDEPWLRTAPAFNTWYKPATKGIYSPDKKLEKEFNAIIERYRKNVEQKENQVFEDFQRILSS